MIVFINEYYDSSLQVKQFIDDLSSFLKEKITIYGIESNRYYEITDFYEVKLHIYVYANLPFNFTKKNFRITFSNEGSTFNSNNNINILNSHNIDLVDIIKGNKIKYLFERYEKSLSHELSHAYDYIFRKDLVFKNYKNSNNNDSYLNQRTEIYANFSMAMVKYINNNIRDIKNRTHIIDVLKDKYNNKEKKFFKNILFHKKDYIKDMIGELQKSYGPHTIPEDVKQRFIKVIYKNYENITDKIINSIIN